MSKVDWSIVAIVGSGGDIEKARKWLLDRGLIEALAEFDGNRAARATRRAKEVARLDVNRADAARPPPEKEMTTPVSGASHSAWLGQATGVDHALSLAARDSQKPEVVFGEPFDRTGLDAADGYDGARWAFEERSAIIEFDGGLPRPEAERLARNMAAALALLERREEDRVIAEWRHEIEGVTAAGKPWDILRAASLAFLAGPHACEAVRAKWPLSELWGVFAGDPAAIPIRMDAWGLVSGMALSSFTYCVVEITGARAVLETRSGARHFALRKVLMPETVPWWRHRALTGGGRRRSYSVPGFND